LDKSKILEELKRINFITNYEVGSLVSENESKKENILFEQKVNNLFEPKKKVVNEQAALQTMMDFTKKSINDAAERAKWARGTDPIGYWRILFESLTKSGVPVKWQVANDPVKSTYMYWGPWVIYKLGDYNITLSTPKKNILYFKFRNNGGKYVGQQNLKDIQLDSECINLYFLASEVFKKNINQLLSYFYTNWQGHARDTTGCLGKKTAIDGEMRLLVKTSVTTSWETELGNYIKKYLPADAKFVDGTSGKQITYGTTGLMLNFTKNGWIEFPENGDKNKVPISYGKWYWDEKTKSPIVNASFASFMDVPSLIKDPYTKLIKPDLEKKKKDYEKQNKEIERKADLVYTNLIKAFDYDNDGVDNDWDGTHEDLAAKAVEMIDSREVLELVNKKVIARGYYSDIASWFKDEMSSIDPYEYDRVVNKLNALGYKLDKASWLGYLAAYTVASPLRAVDQTVTAVQDKTNYANKQTAGAVAKYSEKQVIDILNKEVSPSIDFLAQLLLNSSRWYNDDEVIIEKAFSRINTKERYNQLKTVMGQDPYQFVKKFFVNTYITYGKQALSVDGSYNAIFQPSITNLTGLTDKPNLIFTADDPAGTTKTFAGTPLFYKIAEKLAKDPYLVGGKAIVPEGFLWGANLTIYPDPRPYSTQLINQNNLGREKYNNPRSGERYTSSDSLSKQMFYAADQMSRWNSDLANQEKMIPKYCATTFKYQPTVKQQQQVGKEAYKTVDVPVGEGTDISMAAYCKDFGGLWVYDSQKANPYCGCRDKKNQYLSGNLKVIDKTTGKEGVVNISKGFKENTSTNWTHPETIKNVAKYTIQAISTLAAIIYPPLAPIINIVAGVTNTTIALSQEKKAEAAIFVLFDILPGIKSLGISKAVAENLAKKVASGTAESLAASEAQTLNKIINYQDYITDNVKQIVKKSVESGEVSELTGRVITQASKNMEKQLHDKLGSQDITRKGIAKTVAKELDKV
jgi:hypothetical protein